MSCLALDLATTSGWAFGQPGETPRFGTFTLPNTGDDLGRFGVTFLQWLTAKLRELEPKEVVFEAPILPRETNIQTLKKLYSISVVCEMACALQGVPCSEIPAGTWRKSFLGQSYPSGGTRDELKRAVIAACRQMGWEPNSSDDADALGIWFVASCARNQQMAANDAVARMAGPQ